MKLEHPPNKLIRPTPQFTPCHMFFYGSLMDPKTLKNILELPSTPVLQPASVTDFATKMFGIYPTLYPKKDSKVTGMVWEVTLESQFKRLEEYEGSAYTWCECDVEWDNGQVLKDCRTFCWASDVESGDLEDGDFDMERYRRHFRRPDRSTKG
ncbi:uncharacterized protein BDR25DRAFT_224347 [Lindgomyces ingoldianus]|uniref:Uncharacterized protein n=1 Tax=Lindgomyces ingoldianus TaxID=673940 RepID=A0ACB6QVZ8_9PLEO|nr:uncharacterized protein BDR25DRAFT_224347 [Lindgomyces ingoldianus]KAF2471041.1 hypothetical protein BDR25DRAFT_224347 [Lindgomyces ingoldianus]